jgi:hypothetical protein
MNGFGFIEYEDAMDARDVVPGKITRPLVVYDCLTGSQLSVRASCFSPQLR